MFSVCAVTDGLSGPLSIGRILRAENLDITLRNLTDLLTEECALGEAPGKHGSKDLGSPENQEAAKVLLHLALADEDSKAHRRVEVSTGDGSEDHDRREEGESEGHWVVRQHDAVDEETSAQDLAQEDPSDVFVSVVNFHCIWIVFKFNLQLKSEIESAL